MDCPYSAGEREYFHLSEHGGRSLENDPCLPGRGYEEPPDATSYADGTTRMQATDAFCARIIHVFVSMRRQAVRMDRRSELIRRGSGAVRTRAYRQPLARSRRPRSRS